MPKVCSMVATGFIRWVLLKNNIHAEGMKGNLCGVPAARTVLLFIYHGLTSTATCLTALRADLSMSYNSEFICLLNMLDMSLKDKGLS